MFKLNKKIFWSLLAIFVLCLIAEPGRQCFLMTSNLGSKINWIMGSSWIGLCAFSAVGFFIFLGFEVFRVMQLQKTSWGPFLMFMALLFIVIVMRLLPMIGEVLAPQICSVLLK